MLGQGQDGPPPAPVRPPEIVITHIHEQSLTPAQVSVRTVPDNGSHSRSKSQVQSSDVGSLNIQGSQSLIQVGPLDLHLGELHHGTGISEPAKPVLKASKLSKTYFVLSQSTAGESAMVFADRKLPARQVQIEPNLHFSADYFVALHQLVAAAGPHWQAGTPNHVGARIPLQHTGLHMDRWRYHLTGYDDGSKEILQLVEYGFPLGLSTDPSPVLESSLSNHGSSYNFYPYWDEFLAKGVKNCDVVGGFSSSPFQDVHISPVMTAEKKPSSR